MQNNKQLLSSLHKKSRDRIIIEPYKIPTDLSSRMNAKWSNEELLLGVQGTSFCICDKHTLKEHIKRHTNEK